MTAPGAGLRAAAVLLLLEISAGPAAAAADPVFSDTGPNAEAYGAPTYPIGTRGATAAQDRLVGSYSNFDKIYDTREVANPGQTSVLRRAPQELALNYSFDGQSRSLADYLERQPATGLLIAQGDEILFEHYRYARTDRDRFVGQSMTKTITAMLFGIAMAEGKIRSLDASAGEYLPEIADTEYGKTPLKALLHMASGVRFREDYGGNDDIARLGQALFSRGGPGPAKAVAMFNTREAPPGTRFKYSSAETELLGLVLRTAIGMPLADYASQRLWQPIGAEAPANWVLDTTGQEAGFFGYSAVLRDWARLGILLANDGAWNGRQIIPRQWLIAATAIAPGEEYLAPRQATSYFGYGYQTWIFPGPRRQFALLGIHGQSIYIDPAARLVLVHTAVRPKASRDPGVVEQVTLWHALAAKLAR